MKAWVLCLWLCACQQPFPTPDPYAPRIVEELGHYPVTFAGATIGHVVEIAIRDPIWPERRYRVENLSRQWLGFIDAKGGVYKQMPFEVREQFLGIYPMEEGLALLFDLREPPTVDTTPLRGKHDQ